MKTKPHRHHIANRSAALAFLDRLCTLVEEGIADDLDARVAILSSLVEIDLDEEAARTTPAIIYRYLGVFPDDADGMPGPYAHFLLREAFRVRIRTDASVLDEISAGLIADSPAVRRMTVEAIPALPEKVSSLVPSVRKLAEHDSSPDVRDAAEDRLRRMRK
jgi:hypothetical protein